ncbi:MAG: CHASE3 domain-containing protein [Acidobacteria bacterium]|nr:CHASE3 domain-containing protein [Acidobacteriota bacterium]
MSIVLEKTLPWILIFALLMLAMIGYLAHQNALSLEQAINWEKKTQSILLGLDETLAGTIDIETGGRGFLLTKNDEFLRPFENGKRSALEKIQELRDLFRDSPQQNEQLSELDHGVREKIRYTERYIAYRRTLDLERTVAEMQKVEERDLMDRIRATVNEMKSEELRLLKTREDNLQLTLKNNYWIMIVGTAAGTATLGLAILVVLFEIRMRNRAERALREVNAGLELRVEERTDELQQANVELLKNAAERELLLSNEKGARHEAEIANRQRDEFMAMISHELRTPLNSILGWAQILKTGEVDKKTHEKAINTIINGAENQSRLIKDLLDVARIISGKLTLETVSVNPAELVRSAIETVKPAAEQKRVALSVEIADAAKNCRIDGDPNRLQQVLWNLLANAVKFTPEGGRIDVAMNAEDGRLSIEVKDTGIGIKPEFLPYAFERFRQDRIGTGQAGGLGLGLAIVRYLTEMHGGTVSVESAGEGRGATFRVNLPLASVRSVAV